MGGTPLLWEFHILTLVLHAKGGSELESLDDAFQIQAHHYQGHIYLSKKIPDIRVIDDFIYISKHNLILTRNMLLMLKYTYAT